MRWFTASILVCLIALPGPVELKAAPAGSMAPSFELVTFGGEVYSKESLKGRPTLLVFWAPWCKVCQRDLPLLGEFYQRDKPAQLDELAAELEPDALKFLHRTLSQLELSLRAYGKVLKVSRTIADLAGSDFVRIPHVAEAVQYRVLDRDDQQQPQQSTTGASGEATTPKETSCP